MHKEFIFAFLVTCSSLLTFATCAKDSGTLPKPDIVVASDGSGDFTSIQKAVASIPKDNRERVVVFVKDGIYREKVRVDASYVTLRGESRKGTRIEFAQLNADYDKNPDGSGRAVIHVKRDDFVLENLTVENTAGIVGPHAMALYGEADRIVIVDCDLLSDGADTVSLWLGKSGRYYHARCNFRGAVDFICPRGWCYISDSAFYETKNSAAVWHDGSKDKDMKFVLRNCKFDGTNGWNLARHHHDAQFYFLDCTFSKTMIDRAPYRVVYPISSTAPTEADIQKNKELDRSNIWGERAYFHDCHRDGGDYSWMSNNLSTATGSPAPDQITPAWTFGGKWNPERTPPIIQRVTMTEQSINVVLSETVTVKGKPRLSLSDGATADYVSGSGTETLTFKSQSTKARPTAIVLENAVIIATEAAARILPANLSMP